MSALKDVHYYLSLPYTIEILREDADTWFARVKELPGCITEGDSAQDAAEMILDAMHGWVEIALADGQTIPEPRPVEDYSGKFVVRVPKSLHRDLAQEADRQGISLNQFIGTELARSVGRPDLKNNGRTVLGANGGGLKITANTIPA
jgi:antitoxin HicB